VIAIFVADYFVFPFSFQPYKHSNLQNCNFACCFIWVWNLVFYIESGT